MPVLTIGQSPLSRVEELRIPFSIALFTQDAALIEANRHWLVPHFLDDAGAFEMVFQSWIFEHGGRVVLVDPCTGNGIPHPMPHFDRIEIPFIERMGASGYRPEDVDYVVCTHLHHDHCGWNTRLRGDRWVPTFPNARYLLSSLEYARWGPDRDKYSIPDWNAGVFERSVQPVVEAGLVDWVHGDRAVMAGLTVMAAPGHTIGHQMLHLESAGCHALFTGDCFHHPIQLIATDNEFGFPEDARQVSVTRRRVAEIAGERGGLLIPAHLQAPYAVAVSKVDGELKFAAAAVPMQ